MEIKASKAQRRLMALAGLEADTYKEAHDALVAAGYLGSGIPDGMMWLDAVSMSDDELLAATWLQPLKLVEGETND